MTGKYLHLFVENSEESNIARDYLKMFGFDFSLDFIDNLSLERGIFDQRYSCGFANSLRNSFAPTLLSFPDNLIYLSLFGVESFLRDDMNINNVRRLRKACWESNNLYYDEKEKKLVRCFDKYGEKIFEGSIEKAPWNFVEVLNSHNFKDWHDVSSWQIGKLSDLEKKKDGRGIIHDNDAGIALFPYDLELLKNNKIIPITDSRCYMQVLFEAYFNDNGNIYGVYANMTD